MREADFWVCLSGLEQGRLAEELVPTLNVSHQSLTVWQLNWVKREKERKLSMEILSLFSAGITDHAAPSTRPSLCSMMAVSSRPWVKQAFPGRFLCLSKRHGGPRELAQGYSGHLGRLKEACFPSVSLHRKLWFLHVGLPKSVGHRGSCQYLSLVRRT